MNISIEDKELAAVAISVAAGCKPCTSYHLRAARKLGRTEDEIRGAAELAACVRNDATAGMLRHASAEVGDTEEGSSVASTDRVALLGAVGAAYAVSSSAGLARHVEAARQASVTDAELAEIVELARAIKQMAASHAEDVVAGLCGEASAESGTMASCCGG